ncbi:MAG: hypothetical protein ABI537_10565 [Casimicrobiaceae bacterium]
MITAAVPQNLGETFANPYRNEDTVLLRLDTVAVIERKVVSWKRRV